MRFIKVTTKNEPRLTVMRGKYLGHEETRDDVYHHDILKIKTVSGQLFIIDTSGAQLGDFDPVTKWEEYVRSLSFDKSMDFEANSLQI